jgi:hypothetical protein
MPDDDSRVVSPYLGIYAGLTFVFTLATAGYWIRQEQHARSLDKKERNQKAKIDYDLV